MCAAVGFAEGGSSSRKMKVLVIGGTGLMGVPTVKKLVRAGHDVSILTRGQGLGQGTLKTAPDIPEGTALVTCDRNDAQALQKVLKGFEVIVDFVVQHPTDLDAIVAAHRASPLRHYIFISSNMVYPGGPEAWDISQPSDVEAWREEDADVVSRAPGAPEIYGGHKLRCELVLQEASVSYGLPYTIFRPPAVVGPRCDNRFEYVLRLASGLPPLAALPDRPYNKDAQHAGAFQIVFCDDVAAAIVAAISVGDKAHGQVFNIAQAEALTLVDFVRTLQRGLSPRATSFVMPDPEAVARELSRFNFPCQGRMSIDKARRDLDWTPTPVAEFLRESAIWHEDTMTVSSAKRQKSVQ